MGLPTNIDIDRRITDEEAIRDALDTADVTRFEDEHLDRLHRILYPVFRVTYGFTAGGHMIRGDEHRTDTILIDGLWSGNDSELAFYTEDTADTDRVASDVYDFGVGHDGPGRTVLFEFQATNDRASALLADRIGRYFTDNGYDESYADELRRTFEFAEDFEFDAFGDVVAVDRVYLPFWVAEIHDSGEDNATLRAFRGVDGVRRDDRTHSWLASFVGTEPTRLVEYGYRLGTAERPTPPAADGTDEGVERETPPSSDQSVDSEGSPDDGLVQPEGVDLDVETLLDPSPERGFGDVGGMDSLKSTLEEAVIDPLERPEAYAEYGIGAVNGVLLHGPPGCGKTHIAGALAGELGFSFLETTPADFTSKYMGQPADNVAGVFEVARANQPCLVFVDEIDAIAGAREDDMNTSEQQMVNQLLTELEAIADEDVVVVAATNLVEDVDRAIRRSGRFDQRIEVPPPDADARREILSLYLDERPTVEDIHLDTVVSETAGYAASDVELIADEGAREALQDGADIAEEHLVAAVEGVRTSIPEYDGTVEDQVDVTEPAGVDLSAHRLLEPNPDRTFDDVGGMTDLKETLEETVIDPQRNADAYAEYGLGVTDGVLLHGPPGCGKTHVAGALAGELDHAFLPVTPADVTSKWMGRPAKNVADLFTIAEANAPCVLFVDEIDAIAGSRSGGMNTSEQQMVNQLLTELESVGEDVVVVAATNLVEDIDGAIRRSGRFDERVEVPPPGPDARREVLEIHLRERPTGEHIEWDPVVGGTAGYAASDLQQVADTAARMALRDGSAVQTTDLLAAVESTTTSIPEWVDGAEGRRNRTHQ